MTAGTPAEAAPKPPPPSLRAVPVDVRPAGSATSDDRAVVLSGDATGLHVLSAEAREGYAWRTVATLSDPTVSTARWTGQSCVTGSRRFAVVVYAGSEAVNHEDAFRAGGRVAVVNLVSGSVRGVPVPASLAYHNPGCGAGDTAVISSSGFAGGRYSTRMSSVDAATGRVVAERLAIGQLTSAVPVAERVVAAEGNAVVDIDLRGGVRNLVGLAGTPFRLAADRQGGVGYEVAGPAGTEIHRFAAGRDARLTTVAARSVQLRTVAGQLYLQGALTGVPKKLPGGWRAVPAPADAELSTEGGLAVTAVDRAGGPAPAGQDGQAAVDPLTIAATVVATGRQYRLATTPTGASVHPAPATPAAAGPASGRSLAGSPATDTTDPNRTCAVPRNDPSIQTLQPTPEMGEWAADLAVKGALTVSRPADWNGSGLPAYTPQGLFPSRTLIGGGQVPAQILLGVMAQESNIWQADSHTTDGESGNFLQGGFYGRNVGIDSVNFGTADCGYGAAQVTTGMTVAEGTTVYSAVQQKAIAVDYAANIAAGLQILQDKWNQLKQVGVLANNASPASLENWWFALWAYNSGWHAQGADATGQYGLGWTNNPANEDYPPDRLGFLDAGYDDARVPGHWTYPERVLGWAAHPLLRVNWRTGVYQKAYAFATFPNGTAAATRPPLGAFCTAADQCDMTQIHKPSGYPNDPGSHCLRDDLKCWWHAPATWVQCPAQCGTEFITYSPGAPQPSMAGKTLYAPDCTIGLPAGALIVDDVPAGVGTGTGCARAWTNHGSLTWQFGADSANHYPSKIDFRQLDTGFGGHFWYAHAWRGNDAASIAANTKHKVTGTWTLDQAINGWARVLVYIPDHGAGDPQAMYSVHGSDSNSPDRTVVEGNYLDDTRVPAAGHWESIGAFNFAGVPSVSLDNMAHLATDSTWVDGDRSVSWDAIAFQPLPGQPRDQIVALGDSYASGEGASNDPVNGAWDYYRSSDHDGRNENGDSTEYRDSCHRSPLSWSRQATLPGRDAPVGVLADSFNPAENYHMTACSGAVAASLRTDAVGQWQEGPQLKQGYLDQHTTLVTLSAGGNDARFIQILQQCVDPSVLPDCQNTVLAHDSQPLSVSEPALINGGVRSAVTSALQQIHAQAPNAKIMLMGYPRLLEKPDGCVLGITANETTWLNAMGDTLNDSMRVAAAGVPGVTFADPRAAFAGKGVCGSPAEIRSLTFTLTRGDGPAVTLWPGVGLLSQQTMHPTVAGATTYGTVATATLATMF